MKVLYIGHYKETGGWAQAATDHIIALDAAGVDVVCRNVTLTADKQVLHPKILELEKKSSDGCDICIQHVLPHHLVGTKSFRKNIAFLEAETNEIKELCWFEHLKQMDEIWVANHDLKKSFGEDFNIPIHVVHHPCNTEKYKKRYREFSLPVADSKFKFYFVGDFNDRKNLEAVVSCFHSEFDPAENAILLLKVKKFAKPPEELKAMVDDFLLRTKASLRMFKNIESYNKDIVITEDMSESDLMSFHQYCDCFVCPSHGEAWSIPSFDAMAFGNTPICSNFGGPKEFITSDDKIGKLIDGSFRVCKSVDSAFPDMFTAREYWLQPDEKQIRQAMRAYYEDWKSDPISHKIKAAAEGIKTAEKFSHENIGSKMKELLV